MKTPLVLGLSCGPLLFASLALAVPRATPDQMHETRGTPARPPVFTTLDFTPKQAEAQLAKIAAWYPTMQSTDCTNPEAGIDASMTACQRGGIIEVESGPGHSIVESDNTQESITVWSDNQELNGIKNLSNISLAFQYLATHPGYLEWRDGAGTGPDYYSVYNCGWGVRAVIQYEKATGDTSHHTYGATCADHIATNAAMLITAGDLLDVGPAAWGASGLWLWGEANGDATSKSQAAAIGAEVKAWIDAVPSNVATQEWAMTGAAAFYGVVASYMKEHPSELVSWVTKMAPELGGWVDESMPATPNDWTDWRNALNAWNMLGHFTAAQALGAAAAGKSNQMTAIDILNKLAAQENPKTGAIAGSQQRPSTEAESWITAYFVNFGLLEVISAPEGDAGADGGKDGGAGDGGGPPPDASSAHDAGGDARAEAGPIPPPPSSGGCSCRTAGAAPGERAGIPALASLACFFGLALSLFRRRRA